MKFVNDSVHRLLLITQPLDIFHWLLLQNKQTFSNWNCFHTVVRGTVGTYLVPCWRICYF